MPRSSRASSMPEARSSARLIASTSAFPVGATPVPPALCTIRASPATRPEARHRARPRSSPPGRSASRSAATTHALSARPPGTYGTKPPHGLVPSTVIMPIELTLDHAGPMTATVADNALLLEVLAGDDGLDPRQYAPRTAPYTEALGRGVDGLRIGLVKEGFGHPNSEKDVDAKVRSAAAVFGKLGAKVGEVSVPMHTIGPAIWSPIALEGATELMMKGNGFGTNWRGLFVTSLIDAHSAWRHRADELSDTLKLSMLIGHYFVKHHRGHFYAKAQNLSRKLRAAYDAPLKDFDLLAMPTLPLKATPLPPA